MPKPLLHFRDVGAVFATRHRRRAGACAGCRTGALRARRLLAVDRGRVVDDEGATDVRYLQFMGKDNVPFHTVGFPVTLFGSQEPWKVVDYVKGLNWMNYYGGKFSTSGNRGIFMDTALELLPADYWRWYLLANAPESDDSNFTWEHFQVTVNHDLADVLGNFVNRIAKFCAAILVSSPQAGNREAAGGDLSPKRSVFWGDRQTVTRPRWQSTTIASTGHSSE